MKKNCVARVVLNLTTPHPQKEEKKDEVQNRRLVGMTKEEVVQSTLIIQVKVRAFLTLSDCCCYRGSMWLVAFPEKGLSEVSQLLRRRTRSNSFDESGGVAASRGRFKLTVLRVEGVERLFFLAGWFF